jgi:hypothetical protein
VIQATRSKRLRFAPVDVMWPAQLATRKRNDARRPVATHAGIGYHNCDLRSPRSGCNVKSAFDAPLSATDLAALPVFGFGCNRANQYQ